LDDSLLALGALDIKRSAPCAAPERRCRWR